MNQVLEDITNKENIGNFPKHVWLEFVSDELKDKLFKLKSDNGMIPLGTVDEIVQLFVNDIEKIGNALTRIAVMLLKLLNIKRMFSSAKYKCTGAIMTNQLVLLSIKCFCVMMAVFFTATIKMTVIATIKLLHGLKL